MDDLSSASSVPTLPSAVVLKQAPSVTSSCSSTSTESSWMRSSNSASSASANDMTIGVGSMTTKTLENHTAPPSETMAKLSLMLDEVRELAQMGRNATLKHKCSLPPNVLKSDIHVHVDIDERARAKRATPGQIRLEDSIVQAIRDDLRSVYSATEESAKLILCIVIVVMTDGSLSRTLLDGDGVVGLSEVGLVWRLFEADDLRVYEGGLVVQSEDVGFTFLDLFRNQGRSCLLDKLVPKVANDIMSRIGDSNEQLLVEI